MINQTLLHFLPIKRKFYLFLGVLITTLLLTSLISIIDLRQIIINEKKEDLINLVQIAKTNVQFFYELYKKDYYSENDAKKMALNSLSKMIYDNNNYFYVYDYNCILLLNKSRPDLIGKNRCEVISPDGIYYVKEGISKAETGGGFYTFLFNAGGENNQPKRKFAYAEGFEPWQWMIGTGDIIDDINQKIYSHILKLILIAIIGFFLSIFIINKIYKTFINEIFKWIASIRGISHD